MILKIIIIIFIIFVIFNNYWSKKCSSPYDMTLIFGKKRSGKTTLLQKLCIKYKNNGWQVYSNFELFGANHFEIEDFGKVKFPPHSLILVDECSLIFSNRDFREFAKKRYIEEYFRYIGHYKNKVIMCSQSFDIDKKLRDLTDNLYLLKNIGGYFTIAMKIRQSDKLHNSKGKDNENDNENFITKDFTYYLPFSWIYTFNPRYFKFFNSFNIPRELPKVYQVPYVYKDHDYLLAYSRYNFYKKEQLKDIYNEIKRQYKIEHNSFKIDNNFIMCHVLR